MNSFEANKIIGAVLGTIFVLFGGSLLAEALFHAEAPEVPGYEIVAAEPGEGGEAAPAAAEAPPIAALLQTADVEAGASQFRKCTACHSIEQGGANKVGPALWDVVMRPVASVPDFGYSAAMQDFSEGGEVAWDYEHLNGFLENPKGYVPGTIMAFAGLRDPEDRANLIAYLREQADSPAPLPEAPAEGAAEAEAPADAPADAAAPAEGAAAEAPAADAPAGEDTTANADATTQTDPAAGAESSAQAGATVDAEPAPQAGADQAPTMTEEQRPSPPAADQPQDAAATQPESQEAPAAEAAPAEETAAPAAAPAEEAAAPAPAEGAAETQVAAAEPAAIAGDPAAGKSVFRKCMACHAVGEGAQNKIGPELNGIVGEAVASVEGYNFSPALQEYAGTQPTWDVEQLTAWLEDPRALVPGTKMVFPGLKKPEDLANVIAYLATFDENGATTDN
ncbi:cytochrome c family protein [Aurantimonas sp. A2-1-M11]|uniref:c-type cytochrome n=1 Tax=Aurantimonas sp. A2-1-M11 TaxID=3113712 RepID=UPI002F94E1CC